MGSYTQPSSHDPSACRSSPPRTCKPQMGRARSEGFGLYPSVSGWPLASSGSLSQKIRPHNLGPHAKTSTAPLPVSSYQMPASRGSAALAVAAPSTTSAAEANANLIQRRDNAPCADPRSPVDVAVRHVCLNSKLRMSCFDFPSWRQVFLNTPKRQNSELEKMFLGGKEMFHHDFGHACACNGKSLTTNSLRSVQRYAARSHSIFSDNVLAFKALTPWLRPTSSIHDHDRYPFTYGNTLSFQINEGRTHAAEIINQGQTR